MSYKNIHFSLLAMLAVLAYASPGKAQMSPVTASRPTCDGLYNAEHFYPACADLHNLEELYEWTGGSCSSENDVESMDCHVPCLDKNGNAVSTLKVYHLSCVCAPPSAENPDGPTWECKLHSHIF